MDAARDGYCPNPFDITHGAKVATTSNLTTKALTRESLWLLFFYGNLIRANRAADALRCKVTLLSQRLVFLSSGIAMLRMSSGILL
jgi:hypothetical protein